MRYAIIATMLLLSGCTQWKKITGADSQKDNINLAGAWAAPINGDQMQLLIGQQGAQLSGLAATHQIDPKIHGHITGNVSGRGFSIKVDEGALCVNKITISGEENSGNLYVTITGLGNNLPGTTCYPSAIDTETVFSPS